MGKEELSLVSVSIYSVQYKERSPMGSKIEGAGEEIWGKRARFEIIVVES